MMGTYRLVVTENAEPSMWYRWRLFEEGDDGYVADGYADTRWGARREARRWVKRRNRQTRWEYEVKA